MDKDDKAVSLDVVSIFAICGVVDDVILDDKTGPVDTVAVSLSSGVIVADEVAASDIVAASVILEILAGEGELVSVIVLIVINGEVVEFEPVDTMLSVIDIRKITHTIDITD